MPVSFEEWTEKHLKKEEIPSNPFRREIMGEFIDSQLPAVPKGYRDLTPTLAVDLEPGDEAIVALPLDDRGSYNYRSCRVLEAGRKHSAHGEIVTGKQ